MTTSSANGWLMALEALLPKLEYLVQQPDRDLIAVEEMVDVGRGQGVVPGRLHESIITPGAVMRVERDPHFETGGFSGRYLRAIVSTRVVNFDVAPNRVLARVTDRARNRVAALIASGDIDGLLLKRARRARERLIVLRHAPGFEQVGPMRPRDMMHRSLRLAPRYKPVLELHRLTTSLQNS